MLQGRRLKNHNRIETPSLDTHPNLRTQVQGLFLSPQEIQQDRLVTRRKD